MMTGPDIARAFNADRDAAALSDWFFIVRLPVPYGPPVIVGAPVLGRAQADKLLRIRQGTGGTYVLFAAEAQAANSADRRSADSTFIRTATNKDAFEHGHDLVTPDAVLGHITYTLDPEIGHPAQLHWEPLA